MVSKETLAYLQGATHESIAQAGDEWRMNRLHKMEIASLVEIIKERNETVDALRRSVWLSRRAFRKVFDEFVERIEPMVPLSWKPLLKLIREDMFPPEDDGTDLKVREQYTLTWKKTRFFAHLKALAESTFKGDNSVGTDWDGAYSHPQETPEKEPEPYRSFDKMALLEMEMGKERNTPAQLSSPPQVAADVVEAVIAATCAAAASAALLVLMWACLAKILHSTRDEDFREAAEKSGGTP